MSKNVEVKYKIEGEHLTWVDDALLNELVSFLEEKLGSDELVISRDKNFVLIGASKDYELSKRLIKVYIKRFLYKFELLDRLRVIAGEEDTYIIHKRRGIQVTHF
ncbi:MAG: 60S ribosomal protein L22 [Candidatus Helarchaeota archaeon]